MNLLKVQVIRDHHPCGSAFQFCPKLIIIPPAYLLSSTYVIGADLVHYNWTLPFKLTSQDMSLIPEGEIAFRTLSWREQCPFPLLYHLQWLFLYSPPPPLPCHGATDSVRIIHAVTTFKHTGNKKLLFVRQGEGLRFLQDYLLNNSICSFYNHTLKSLTTDHI